MQVYEALKRAEAVDVKTIPMGHGKKICRIVVWTFLTTEQQMGWIEKDGEFNSSFQ